MGDGQLKRSRRCYLSEGSVTELNTVDVWTAGSAPIAPAAGKIWLIYVKGGAWRDPTIDSESFEPAVTALWDSSLKSSIAGFASINYRLSPYPSHPDNPSSPEDPSRNVHYPSHLLDVAHALLYLDQEYHIKDRYLLAGHSAGATMAFELHDWYMPGTPLPLPACVIGIAGIYHFEAFIDAHSGIPAYQQLMENAFPDRKLWGRASPYTNDLPGTAIWEHAKVVVISHSDQDELVEKGQSSFMLDRVRSKPAFTGKVQFLEASGSHDEIWRSGHILAGLISKSLQMLVEVPAISSNTEEKLLSI